MSSKGIVKTWIVLLFIKSLITSIIVWTHVQ